MKNLKELLDEYNFGSADTNKSYIIEQLEFIEDEGKWPFLIKVLENTQNEELERIEVLKIFELNPVNPIPKAYYDRALDVLVNILKTETDYDVRNHAAIAASGFANERIILDLAKEIILNKNEDIDTRWNVFDVFEINKNEVCAKKVLTLLLEEEEFKHAAARVLYTTMPPLG